MAGAISCIITDDEPYARKGLQGYIEKAGFFDIKGQCEDAIELGTLLQQQPVDLLFLDIQMPHLGGIDFVKSLDHPPKIIFTTAFAAYALQGFELDVLDYLVKPIAYERFLKAANKARDYFNLRNIVNEPSYLFVKAGGRLEKILFNDVLYVEGMENYVVIHTTRKKIIVHSTLKALLDKLPEQQFIQTHKSYIVACNRVTTIERYILYIGQHPIPISRQLKEQVMRVIINRRNE